MEKFISKLLKYKYFFFGWIVSVLSLILSMGFNIRWNFLNLISMLAYLVQLIVIGYNAIKSGEIRIRDILYPVLIVGSLYGLYILVSYLTYKFSL
ncbi:hypothetical protein IGI43_001632 [Enterococcus sp. AZ126]